MKTAAIAKLKGIDTFALVRKLQAHGIRVLGSTIIGLENHTPENIQEVIDCAVRHEADFHQFMLYTPLPGTPLHADLSAQGRMLDESDCPHCDMHGQHRFNYRHPHIHDGRETEFLLQAFRCDFERNGPSIMRMVRTLLNGWQRYKRHPDARIYRRFQREIEGIAPVYAAAVSAAKKYYRHNPLLKAKMSALLNDLVQEFGGKSRRYGIFGGSYMLEKICAEEQRLAQGWTYEPPTFYDANDAALDIGLGKGDKSALSERPKACCAQYASIPFLMPNRPSERAMFRRRYRTLRAIVARNGRQNTRTRSFGNGTFRHALTHSAKCSTSMCWD